MTDDTDGADGTTDASGGVVYELPPHATGDDVERDRPYLATVNGVVEYGAFVDLSPEVSGLIHESDLDREVDVGEQLVVELETVRAGGDLSFEAVENEPTDVRLATAGTEVDVADLGDQTGETVTIRGEVLQINQTGGPTIFQVRDGTGVVPCAAFEDAGVRAHPEVAIGDLVTVSGRVERRDGGHQVEVSALSTLVDDDQRQAIENDVDDLAEPPELDPLVEWPVLDRMWDDLRELARRLRRAVLDGRPIRMRHHADVDGICAAVPVQRALAAFTRDHYADPEAPGHLLKRLPSKAPYYELEDVTRDLNYALENRARHGQKLPFILMLDNGSTAEDTDAYRNLDHYDVPVAVLDHHHPDPEAVESLVDVHVNPYLYDEDYSVTTGMLAVEVARMIAPEITDDLDHLPAIAGTADRSGADAMAQYRDLAAAKGYDAEDLRDVGEALDYATHWLDYSAGDEIVTDALNAGDVPAERHEEIVSFLADRAERDVQRQIDAVEPHVNHERLDNGAHLYRIDVERHAHRFTYPAPGKTTGAVHDEKVAETGDPVITIGYGPDFSVLRSDGVRLDIPSYVTELADEVEGGGVSGGGHLVVGSIKFVSGRREAVLDALVEKMADAEIDMSLGSAGTAADAD